MLQDAIATRKKKQRFGRSDHPVRRAELGLPGLDLRSPAGRAYTRAVMSLLQEYGAADLARLKELASLRITMEKTAVEAMSGGARAKEDLVRVSNLIARREGELRARRAAQAPKGPSLADIIARHRKAGE